MKHNIWTNNYLRIYAFILAIMGFILWANQAPQAADTSDIAPGSSMKEIEVWIKRELPKIGRDSVVTTDGKKLRTETTFEIRNATLTDCILKFESISHWVITPNAQSITATIPMKNLDLTRLVAVEASPSAGYTASKPSFVVRLVSQSDTGSQQLFDTVFNNNDGKPPKTQSVKAVNIRVRDMGSANQAAETLRQAAVLCGAQDRPVDLTAMVSCETGTVAWLSCRPPSVAAAPTQPVTTKSAENSTATMTNNEVIQLVKAGLSEQVVITSIRQTPTKDFDLTAKGLIELNKAGVTDAVILVMQERVAPTQNKTASETKAPSKYDATLAEPPKSVVAPAPQNGCAGIEMMGLFKNEIFDRAMGGGITEWLVKIRNNTAVTKIVIFGWRDQYGQEQTSQVQIRGGEIASPRVDMTQARYIAPTTNVKLVSCQ